MGKKRHSKPNPIRKWIRAIASGISAGLVASPVFIGIPRAVQEQMAGGNGIAEYVKQTVGVDIQPGMTQDINRVTEVWIRNILLVGGGLAIRFFIKRA